MKFKHGILKTMYQCLISKSQNLILWIFIVYQINLKQFTSLKRWYVVSYLTETGGKIRPLERDATFKAIRGMNVVFKSLAITDKVKFEIAN